MRLTRGRVQPNGQAESCRPVSRVLLLVTSQGWRMGGASLALQPHTAVLDPSAVSTRVGVSSVSESCMVGRGNGEHGSGQLFCWSFSGCAMLCVLLGAQLRATRASLRLEKPSQILTPLPHPCLHPSLPIPRVLNSSGMVTPLLPGSRVSA